MCKYLLQSGSDVNAKGGEAVATPAMWATQRCNYYIVALLLEYGADPLLTDAQGYNILHLATFDGNVFLLTLLLHTSIPIDCPDPQGHTCLMWAAYKGYPACVDLLLRWGASVVATDDSGLSALHWSLVKGSQGCTNKLVDFGSDRFLLTQDGKQPSDVAREMKTSHVWHRALAENNFDQEGHTLKMPLPIGVSFLQPKILSKVFFFLPFPLVLLITIVLGSMTGYVAIILAVGLVLGFSVFAQKLAAFAPSQMKHIHQTVQSSAQFDDRTR